MSLYMIIDLASISIPFLFSFHPRIQFVKEWKYALPAIILAAIPYLIWDEWFTADGIWGFNPVYHSGIMIGSMPLEEILFFISIPYACLFTYWSMTKLTKLRMPASSQNVLYGVLFTVFALMMIFGSSQWYTFMDGLAAFVILLATFLVKRDLILKFFPVYLIILFPFFIVNGILTGWGITDQVVWYNDSENMGIRVITIPIEDFAYGFSMLLLSTLLFEWMRGRRESA